MKKVIVLASFLGAALLSSAQVSFGPFVGIGVQGPRTYSYSDGTTSTTVTRDAQGVETDRDVSSFTSTSGALFVPKAGLSYKVGFMAKIDVNDYFAISPGIAFQNMTSKLDILGFSSKTSMNYISVPILLQGQFPIGDKINIGLGIGPEFNFLLGGKATSSGGGVSYSAKIKAKGTVTESDDKVNNDSDMGNNVEYYKGMNVSLLVAPFVQFKFGGASLLISPTYYIGLSNVISPRKYSTSESKNYGTGASAYSVTTTTDVNEKNKSKTGGFGVNVALLFGGGK